jgi:hypothetical protein
VLSGSSAVAQQSTTCGSTLAAGASCNVTLIFTPTTRTAVTSSLTFTDNSSTGTTQTVAITGSGIAPLLSINPAAISFADTRNGSASATQTLTVTNTGNTVANISGIALAGADSTAFSLTSGCGATLAINAVCNLTVFFAPNAVRTFSAKVSVASTDPASPTTASLTGNGIVAGRLSVSPAAQTFPSTIVGATSAMLTSIIANTTAQAIYLSSGSLTDSTDFAQSDNCNGLLAAGGNCTVSFTFTPKSAGALSATYAIHDLNNSAAPITVSLSGTSTAPLVAKALLTPSSINFGSVNMGAFVPAQTVTLSNSGSAALSITSIGLTGSNASAFLLGSNSCGVSLAAGASCTISISLLTSAAGSLATTLTVVDAVGTQSTQLSGTVSAVTPPDFTLSATTATQSSYRGRSVMYTLQLTSLLPANAFTNVATLSVTGLPSGATASFAPASVVPGVSSPATTVMTVVIPSVVGEIRPARLPDSAPLGISLAALLFGFWLPRAKRRKAMALFWLILLTAIAGPAVGCGAGAGFAVPTSTSNLVVTAASGVTTHSTTVTLTIE